MVMNWRDPFRPTCFTTITEGQFSVKNIQVCPQKSSFILDLTCIVLELSLPDLSKLIGDEWKKLSENQRAVSLNQNYYFSFFWVKVYCNFAISFNAKNLIARFISMHAVDDLTYLSFYRHGKRRPVSTVLSLTSSHSMPSVQMRMSTRQQMEVNKVKSISYDKTLITLL